MSDQWISHLQGQGARFADGRVVDFGAPEREIAATAVGEILCDLSHEGLLRVAGPDAGAFLHAQLTNDVLALPVGGAQWNGWCSPKGRLLVTMLVWRDEDGYVLQMPRALQAAIQKRLQMFVLRSKVTLSDDGIDRERFGVAGELAAATEFFDASMGIMTVRNFGALQVVRLSAKRYELVAPVAAAMENWRLLAATATKAGAPAWDGLAIEEGVLQVLPATQDAFVPQMANFELIGGVSFKKGCYPGQEIVARTQYRGILKRRTIRVHCNENLSPGEPLYAPEFADQPAGMVANAAPSAEGGCAALVVAQIESIKANSLRARGVDGPALERRPLPYAVPELGNL